MSSLVGSIGLIFLIAVAVNYAWELAQAALYDWPGESDGIWWHCFVASLGDGLLVLIIFAVGWLAFGRRDWFSSPGGRGYLLMITAGSVIAVTVEWIAAHILQRWTYTPDMPRIPGLDIGIVPIVQMLVLPPLIFWTVSESQRKLRHRG